MWQVSGGAEPQTPHFPAVTPVSQLPWPRDPATNMQLRGLDEVPKTAVTDTANPMAGNHRNVLTSQRPKANIAVSARLRSLRLDRGKNLCPWFLTQGLRNLCHFLGDRSVPCSNEVTPGGLLEGG